MRSVCLYPLTAYVIRLAACYIRVLACFVHVSLSLLGSKPVDVIIPIRSWNDWNRFSNARVCCRVDHADHG